jgi:hypothetical protein
VLVYKLGFRIQLLGVMDIFQAVYFCCLVERF